jgi:hypothetical protein
MRRGKRRPLPWWVPQRRVSQRAAGRSALLAAAAALSLELPARAFVVDSRAEGRACDAAGVTGCSARTGSALTSSTGALLARDPELLLGPGFVLVRAADAVAEAACAPEAIARAALTDTLERVGQHLGVDPELAVVLSSAPPSCNSIYYLALANDVRGIGYGHDDGREQFDDTPERRLEGVAFLNDWPYWRAHADEFKGAFHHELAHRWGARVQAQIAGTASNELLGRGLAHWSYFLDTRGSPHEGNLWVQDPSGQHSETPLHGSQFSALDLYLMGVGLPEEVEPFELLRDTAVTGLDCRGRQVSAASPPQTCQSIQVSGQATRISLADILAVEGPRDPPASHDPRSLSALVVVLDGTGAAFSADDCRELAAVLHTRFLDFEQATLGRLRLDPTLSEGGDCDAPEWSQSPPAATPVARSSADGCDISATGLSVRRPVELPGAAVLGLCALLGLVIRASKAPGAGLGSRHDQDW